MNDGPEIHDEKGIECMRASGKLAAQVLKFAGTLVNPGITTDEIDKAVHQMIIDNGAYPSPLGYCGFPKSVCTSVNECICHGIPDSRPLEDGDIINIDVTVYLNGYHGDTSATFLCGDVDDEAKKLVQVISVLVTKESLDKAISICAPGVEINRIGRTIHLFPPQFLWATLEKLFLHKLQPKRTGRVEVVQYTEEQIRRVEESIRIRREAEPVELVQVKKLRKVFAREEKRRKELPLELKLRVSYELVGRLNGLGDNGSAIQQREALESWRVETLKEAKSASTQNSSNLGLSSEEARLLKRALEFNWHALLEDIGLWISPEIPHTEHDDKPENEPEEEEIIAGPPLHPQCNTELHADYGGAAVRWGLTHHKESAADCCQACLDQARNAKPGELKCNIWVYCPSEFGCYSPDKYEHKHQECWLKQADQPKLNFKDKYSESYRDSHPRAPVVVPWMSGVTSA
ncbi:unnamed protein product [Triticum turgidum subsp. durum]|uniref:Peptidase M24 domain-containing protein n=1 Tax=Triticum turgidum subsp. durum TaxID=4567 RepID=A0A9R0Y7V6_TRITD|nr:unnamed protein product [Triticum turgidum subsp. durum]